jgi:hypothetical protein
MEQALRTIRTNKSSTLLWRKKPLKIKDQLIQKVPPAQTQGDDKKRSSRKYHHSLTNVIYPNYNANFLLGGYKIEQQEDGALKQVPYKPGDEKETEDVPQMSLVTYSKAF